MRFLQALSYKELYRGLGTRSVVSEMPTAFFLHSDVGESVLIRSPRNLNAENPKLQKARKFETPNPKALTPEVSDPKPQTLKPSWPGATTAMVP